MEKDDDTPVTIGDLAAQALIISAIHSAFPNDVFLGEESASILRENRSLAERVWHFVSSTHLEDAESDNKLGRPKSLDEMLDIIDMGKGEGGRQGRIWMLDPIDGTATFLRGQQYAVCLCLVEDGEQKVAAFGCPNMSLDSLPITEDSISNDGGYLVSAVKGQGAFIQRLSRGGLQPPQTVKIREPPEVCKLRNVLSLASSTMDSEKNLLVCQKLGISTPSTDLWAQQIKYIALAVGGHDLQIRIPRKQYYSTANWDHAGGSLICEESGYRSTDLYGKELDWCAGRRLSNNFGNVVAPVAIHAQVLKAVQEVLGTNSA
jgi:3'(2'), 5'-bisphosphate nucleotidase